MTQRECAPPPDRLHVALIMDGNGRWAARRGLPRVAGHRKGADAVRCAVEAAPSLGVEVLTLYAFSSDNWQRPADEVATLMTLFRKYLVEAREECVKEGVRVRLVGRRDRLPAEVVGAAAAMEEATSRGSVLDVRLAVDYSGRDRIVEAARRFHCPNGDPRRAFERCLAHATGTGPDSPPVDLLIRTGGEQRLSDFLLWECAYAELYFTPTLWPDFSREEFARALEDFHGRNRRFGRVPEIAATA